MLLQYHVCHRHGFHERESSESETRAMSKGNPEKRRTRKKERKERERNEVIITGLEHRRVRKNGWESE